MADFFADYLVVALVGLSAVVLAGGTLIAGRLVRPRRAQEQKSLTYEAGADPAGGGWSQTHVRYYLYALLFVIFDIEVAFIVPWAVQVEELAAFGLVEMLIFAGILALGLAYAWRKGVLKWD